MTANQYHCATVGAEEAIEAADRINAAHWKAAKAGERGYRKPDALEVTRLQEEAAPPKPAVNEPAAADIAADLSVPTFLRRRMAA